MSSGAGRTSKRASPVPRPGIASGLYPQRAPQREDALERAVHRLRGLLARPQSARREVARFVKAVRGQALTNASDAELAQGVHALREKLARQGLCDALLPEAFALVSETARRSVGMAPFDVQLMAGWAMLRGMVAEMETGEGKTLAVTLPAATAALAGIPVHLISANDYLVERDAEAMRPLYERLGLSVAAVTDRLRDPAARRAAYACDVTYATSSSIAFDYLRDGLRSGRGKGRLALHAAGASDERRTPEPLHT